MRCIDCSHPLCSAPGCTTCRRCRSETCRKPNQCKATIKPLQAKKQPGAMIEKLQFRCESCRYPPCLVCKKQMPKGSRGRFDKQDSLEWTCGDCLTLEESRKVRARDRGEELLECTSCHQSLSCASFSESRWCHRKEQKAICLKCEGTHSCNKCGSTVHQGDCTKAEWNNKKRKLLCVKCKRR